MDRNKCRCHKRISKRLCRSQAMSPHLRRAQQRARPQLEVPKPHELRLERVIFPRFYHTHAPSQPLSAEGVSRAAAASLLPQPCSQGAELREAAPRCHPCGEGGNWPPSI